MIDNSFAYRLWLPFEARGECCIVCLFPTMSNRENNMGTLRSPFDSDMDDSAFNSLLHHKL